MQQHFEKLGIKCSSTAFLRTECEGLLAVRWWGLILAGWGLTTCWLGFSPATYDVTCSSWWCDVCDWFMPKTCSATCILRCCILFPLFQLVRAHKIINL